MTDHTERRTTDRTGAAMYRYPDPHICVAGCDHNPDLFDFAEWLDQPAVREMPDDYTHADIVQMYENGWDFTEEPLRFGERLFLQDGHEVIYCGPSLREGVHEVVTRGQDGEWMTRRLSVGINTLRSAQRATGYQPTQDGTTDV